MKIKCILQFGTLPLSSRVQVRYLSTQTKHLKITENKPPRSSTHRITNNLFMVKPSSSPRLEFDKQTLRLHTQNRDKPMVVLLGWLLAKQSHLLKYANFYTDKGYDALVVRIDPLQLMFPAVKNGAQDVAGDIVKFLHSNDNETPLVLHGLSVGAFIWGEVIRCMARDINKYDHILSRFRVQTWDSIVGVDGMPGGVATTVFPTNPIMQGLVRKSLESYMKLFYSTSTIHYRRINDVFHYEMLLKVPALIFASKADRVGPESLSQSVRKAWEERGVEVTWKCWEDSPHVKHFQTHHEEYVQLLSNHLKLVNPVQKVEEYHEIMSDSEEEHQREAIRMSN